MVLLFYSLKLSYEFHYRFICLAGVQEAHFA